MGREVFQAHLRTVNGGVFADSMYDTGQGPGVVHFGMIANDVIDLLGINYRRNFCHHLLGEFFLHRVNQGDLFVDDQKGVVGRAVVRGITVKITDIPVGGADIVDAFSNFLRFHCESFPEPRKCFGPCDSLAKSQGPESES